MCVHRKMSLLPRFTISNWHVGRIGSGSRTNCDNPGFILIQISLCLRCPSIHCLYLSSERYMCRGWRRPFVGVILCKTMTWLLTARHTIASFFSCCSFILLSPAATDHVPGELNRYFNRIFWHGLSHRCLWSQTKTQMKFDIEHRAVGRPCGNDDSRREDMIVATMISVVK